MQESTAHFESPLYIEVRKRLQRGSLAPAPRTVQVSRAASEQTCVVCQRVIRLGQMLNESVNNGRGPESMHTLCLRVWVDASRALEP